MGSISVQDAVPEDAPRCIVATPEELKTACYDNPNIQAALEALHQDGFAVLKGVVDVTHIKQINSYMAKEADDLVANKKKAFNQGVNCTCHSLVFLLSISHC